MSKCMTPMLGRLPSIDDPRTLRLHQFLAADIAPPPATRLWQTPVPTWGTMGNDRYGNCVIVTPAHLLMSWRANELGDARPISDDAVIQLSRQMGALDGYNILDRLKYWRKKGMFGDNLWAFAAVDPTEQNHVRIAINAMGGLDIGVNLPNAWRNADHWTTGHGPTYRPGSWGGHSVPLVGYDADNVYAVSWGQVIPMSWDALAYYSDEAYGLIDSTWIAKDATAPSGLDLNALHAALRDIGADGLQLIQTHLR